MTKPQSQRSAAFSLAVVTVLAALVSGCAAPPLPTEVLPPTPGKSAVFDFKRYPDRIWDRHLTLTRQAASSCGVAAVSRGGYVACLYSTLDGYVAAAQNPALSDLHVHLPLTYRYNPNRNQRPTGLLASPFPMS